MKAFASITCAAMLLVSAIVGLIAWLSPINPQEAAFNWIVRIAAVIVFPASLVGLIYLVSRPETVPDFLSRLRTPRIGRGGVLFVFECAARDGWTWIDVHYQNRFTSPAHVTVALMPSQTFLMKRNDIEPIAVTFACGPAAYGVLHVPVPVKQEYQGKSQQFDVASEAEYPSGHGECLRNVVGAEMSKLGFSLVDSAAVTLTKIALTGRLLNIRWQSRVKVMLPRGVAESSDQMPGLLQEELWTLADASVQDVNAA